jgi:acid phosphatase type 7
MPMRGFVVACLLAFLAASWGPARAAAPPGHGRILVGAGDIAVCGSNADTATARLLDAIRGTVFTAGDNVYPDGTLRQFRKCYRPTWGRHRDRTRPSPGNHDYHTPGALGYFDYFGRRAGPRGRGYYAYDKGRWRVYSLNSERITRAQLDWLQANLAAHPRFCSLAYWHHPRFSSGAHGNDPRVAAFWRRLYRAGVEVVVNGHDHDYERFRPMTPGGRSASRGIREFVVGTGGAHLRAFETTQPNSVVRYARGHGVLKLTLRAGEYSWRFVGVAGTEFTDAGTRSCHARPA